MRFVKGCLLVLVGFSAGFLAFLGMLVFLITRPSPIAFPPPPISPPPTPLPAATSAQRLEARLYNIQGSPNGFRAEVQAQATEALLASLLSQQLARMGDAPLESPQLLLHEDRLELTARLRQPGFRPQEAQRLTGSLEAVVQNLELTPQGYRAELEITVEEALVNSFLEWQLPRLRESGQFPVTLDSLQVFFRGERLHAVLGLALGPFRLEAGARAAVWVESGRLRIGIEEIDLGQLPLPTIVRQMANEQVEQALGSLETAQLPFELRQISIQEGNLILRALVAGEL